MIAPAFVHAQIENVHVFHPVYNFLTRAEALGMLESQALAMLPLERNAVVRALRSIRRNAEELSTADRKTLRLYEREFGLADRNNVVLLKSASDSAAVLLAPLFGDREKFIYRYSDSSHSVSLTPLAVVETRAERQDDENASVTLGEFGLRLYGTLDNLLGYFLQATNGAVLGGDREVALRDPQLSGNVKFNDLNSDFDFTESHVRLRKDWFSASIGRERKLVGSGFNHAPFISNAAPPFDAVTIGVDFENFEYRFMHASLLAIPTTPESPVGFGKVIPQKYMAFHRFAYRDSWGELAFSESVIYSERAVDLSYVNPLSFFKSLEHANRDRDNTGLGFDGVIRLIKGVQLKGSFFLDDIQFSRIGDDFWSNKSAWNIGAMYALSAPLDLIVEYALVNPYTYTHFNVQNSVTNDQALLAGVLPPNSDQISATARVWWGNRYPVSLSASFRRHGRNITDADGNLIRNVGGDVLQTKRLDDSEIAPFLDGDVQRRFALGLDGTVEIVRGFNVRLFYELANENGAVTHSGALGLRYNDF